MKILLICSKRFYSLLPEIKETLENGGHEILLPNCHDAPETEDKYKKLGKEAHSTFKKEMFLKSKKTIRGVDAVLVLNYTKKEGEKTYKNYVGGATLFEMYDAFSYGKLIYMINPIPKGIAEDEIRGLNPTILNGYLCNIKDEDITYNKLVRDGIPEKMIKNGVTPVTRILTREEQTIELRKKLVEEAYEYLDSGDITELADVLEVMKSILKTENITEEKLEEARVKKLKLRGSFDKGIFLEGQSCKRK